VPDRLALSSSILDARLSQDASVVAQRCGLGTLHISEPPQIVVSNLAERYARLSTFALDALDFGSVGEVFSDEPCGLHVGSALIERPVWDTPFLWMPLSVSAAL
jgi:hypothetical protein